MRDNRYENMWGETPEQQEQRRNWLRGVYDASAQKNESQAPYQNNNDEGWREKNNIQYWDI